MAWLEVYRLRGTKGWQVVDVQSNRLSHLATGTVVPLMADGDVGDPVTGLNPKFEVGAEAFVLLPQLISTVAKADLKQWVTPLSLAHDEIIRARDVLFTGF